VLATKSKFRRGLLQTPDPPFLRVSLFRKNIRFTALGSRKRGSKLKSKQNVWNQVSPLRSIITQTEQRSLHARPLEADYAILSAQGPAEQNRRARTGFGGCSKTKRGIRRRRMLGQSLLCGTKVKKRRRSTIRSDGRPVGSQATGFAVPLLLKSEDRTTGVKPTVGRQETEQREHKTKHKATNHTPFYGASRQFARR